MKFCTSPTRCFVICLILAGCSGREAASPKESSGKQADASPTPEVIPAEYQQLEGTWKIVAYDLNGAKVPEDLYQDQGLTFQGKQFTRVDAAGKTKGSFRLDASKTPKTIDLTDSTGPGQGDPVLGIYEIEGDTLRLCLGIGSEDRPKEFAAKKDSGHALQVLKRDRR